MIEKPNLIACACSLVMGSGGAVNFANGCSVSRTGVGTYAVLVDPQQQVALGAALPVVTPFVAAGVACSVSVAPPTIVSDSSFTPPQNVSQYVLTTSATLGGVGADIAGTLTFLLYAIGVPGAGGL